MKWFRFYHEFVDDPKIAMMSDSDQLLWVKALCLASESNTRGFIILSDDEICWKLRCTVETWKHAVDKFRAKGMIEHSDGGHYRICNWDKRQFSSDTSTERSRQHRARKRFSRGNDNATLQQRDGNNCASDLHHPQIRSDTEQIQNRTDSEQKQEKSESQPESSTPCEPSSHPSSKKKSSRSKKPKHAYSEDFDAFWQRWLSQPVRYGELGSKHNASIAFSKLRKDGVLPDLDKLLDVVDAQHDWKRQLHEKQEGIKTFVPSFPHVKNWLKGRRFDDVRSHGCSGGKGGEVVWDMERINRVKNAQRSSEYSQEDWLYCRQYRQAAHAAV